MAKESALVEKQRAEALDAKLAKLTADLTDSEERLERRDREVARLRERLKPILASPPSGDRDLRLIDLQAENMRLEAEIAELAEKMAAPEGSMQAETGTSDKLERLELRVAALVRENRALQEKLASPKAKDAAASRNLREQMQALAAEVVHLTASVEGADSPINAALAKADAETKSPGAPPSLADRIRALRNPSHRPDLGRVTGLFWPEAMQGDGRGRRNVEAVEIRRHGDARPNQPVDQVVWQAGTFGAQIDCRSRRSLDHSDIRLRLTASGRTGRIDALPAGPPAHLHRRMCRTAP